MRGQRSEPQRVHTQKQPSTQKSAGVIRRANHADARSIAQVLVEAWRAAYVGILDAAFLEAMDVEAISKRWEASLTDHDAVTHPLVIEAQGHVVGFSHFGKPRDTPDSCTGELYALNLIPEVWGRGFGSQLLEAATVELQRQGYEHAYLWVANGNERASALYERRGWKSSEITKQDSRFTPPLIEHRYERSLKLAS